MSSVVMNSTGGRPAVGSVGCLSRAATIAVLVFIAVRLVVVVALVVAARESGRNAHRMLVGWDAQWYQGIAEDGYGFTRSHDGRLLSDFAFFPLYPLLERAVSALTGLRYVDAGLLISACASGFAAWGIFAVSDHVYGPRVGVMATVLWAALPVSVVQSMAYTESLFTALAAWSLHAVLTGRWIAAGLLACAAGLTRPLGIAVVAAVVIPAGAWLVRSRDAAPDPQARLRDLRALLAALIAPLGLLGYLGWVAGQRGDVTGYFDVASGWGNGFDGGAAFVRWIGQLLTGPVPITGGLVVIGLAVLAVLCWMCVRDQQPMPLLIFVTLVVLLALTTSGYFGSKPRYLLPAFPLLLPVARRLAVMPVWLTSTVLAGLTTVAAVYGTVWLLGTGPP
jgi:hypothetical protein